jgi:serine/threonine-protein kinase
MAQLTGQLVGRYRMGELIGEGAMGAVYQALPESEPAPAPVAIKVLHPDYTQDPEFRARFEREMRLNAALQHPHIVPVLDYGSSGPHLYLVMRYVEGQTLGRLLLRRSFSPVQVWQLLDPLCQALDYGHSKGVLHRDVKPSNVLLERREGQLQVYLMDFGLGKRPGADVTLTETGISIGTPEYMSPEAALGEGITQQSDVYSLAILTYELLVGKVPFDLGEPHLVALAQVNKTPPSLIDQMEGFPPALNAVVMRSLSKTAHLRHSSAGEFAQDYHKALALLTPSQQETDYWPA